jgi:hypothetical protein
MTSTNHPAVIVTPLAKAERQSARLPLVLLPAIIGTHGQFFD